MTGVRAMKWLEKKLQIKFLSYGIITAFALLAYCNSFSVPFTLDDFGSISNNNAIHQLFDFPALWKFYANRIVLYFTLSLNYAVHDNGVEGYHIVNLIIHLLNGILFYLILRKVFSFDYFKGKLLRRYEKSVSLIAAVMFVTHPMQVNAVTYIVQRTASLAACFYLLAILFFIKYRLQDKPYQLILTVLFTATAMFTKENTITIPFLLLLIELMFFLKDGRTKWHKRILIFLPLFATVPIIPATNLLLKGYSQSDPNVTFKASTSMDRMQYFYTELNVILLYIRLMFVPYGQNFDYSNDFPMSPTIWDNYSYISFVVLLFIGLLAVFTIKRNRLVSLGIIWFFTGLAVESSFISIKDVYFEHRLYFPCAGFIMFIIGMVFYERKPAPAARHQSLSETAGSMSVPAIRQTVPATRRRKKYLFPKPLLYLLAVSVLLIPLYTSLTIRRNYIYSDSIRLWSDAVLRAPGSDRAHSVLATGYLNAYDDKKKNMEYLDLAELEFKKAIDLNYYNSTAHTNLSKVYLLKEEYDKCIDEAKRAISMTKSEYAQFNLGSAYKKLDKTQEALDAFKAGYGYNSRSSFILKALGDTYYELNDYKNAKKYYEEYLEVNKRYSNKDIKEKLEKIEQSMSAST